MLYNKLKFELIDVLKAPYVNNTDEDKEIYSQVYILARFKVKESGQILNVFTTHIKAKVYQSIHFLTSYTSKKVILSPK